MQQPLYFSRIKAVVVLAAMGSILTACAVGPDFERPPAPTVKTYESTALPAKTESIKIQGGVAQTFAEGGEIPSEWWTLFHSESLNGLIAKALTKNPDIAAAEATLRESHENMLAGYGPLLPQIDAGFNVSRQKISGNTFGSSASIPPFTIYNASIGVSYAPDVFGGNRRQLEALEASEDYSRFQLEAARLSISTNVVTTAVLEASLRGQIKATQNIIDEEKKQLDLLRRQFELGAIAKSNVLTQAATLAQEQATLPPLEKQLAQVRHQLSTLIGEFPSQEPGAIFELSSLALPEKLPVSLPSKLVEQRPDIRAAEATLHAASAEIGVATANMLPQFPLTGDIGSDAGKLASLFASGTGIWSLAAGITQPIFHGGELLHKRKASEAAFDAAAAQYQKTVLNAFRDVADALRALQADAVELKAQTEAERAAHESLSLARQQYKEGAVSYLDVLTAEQTEEQTRIALVQAQARRYADTAALFAALGGGWWNRIDRDENGNPAETGDARPAPITTPTMVNFNKGDR